MKNTRTLVIILISVLLIVCVVLGVMYFLTDVLQSNKKTFYKYASEIDIIGFFDQDFYGQYDKKLAEGKYEKTGTISLQVTSDGEETVNGSIKYNTKSDRQNKLLQTDVEVISLGESVLDFGFLRDEDLYGLIIKGVLNEYIVLENVDIKEMAEKLGVEDTSNIPNRIDFADYTNLFSLSGQEIEALKELGNKCIQIIDEQIPDKKYSNKEKETIELDGQNVLANGYKVSLNAKEYQNISLKVFESLKGDETVSNITKSRLDRTGLLTFSDYQNYIDDLTKEINEEVSQMNDKELKEEIYTIAVYEKDRKFAKLELTKNYKNNQTYISMEHIENKRILTIYEKDDSSESLMKLAKTVKGDETIWECILEVRGDGQSPMILSLTMSRIGDLESDNIRHTVEAKYVQDGLEIVISLNEITKIVTKVQIDGLNEGEYTLLNTLRPETLNQLVNVLTEQILLKVNPPPEEEEEPDEAERLIRLKRAALKDEILMWRIERASSEANATSLDDFIIELYQKELINELQVIEAIQKGTLTIGNETIVLVEPSELNSNR